MVTIAERKPATTPVKPTLSRVDTKVVGTRKGDVELGHCRLELPPQDLLVSSTGGRCRNRYLAGKPNRFGRFNEECVDNNYEQGQIRFRKNLDDLFGEEKALLARLHPILLQKSGVVPFRMD